MVDKDSHWPHVKSVLRTGAADLVNVHPHNMGRLSHALRIAEAAAAMQVDVAIGANGIFGVQDAAYQHLAAIIGLSRPCEDIPFFVYAQGPARDFYNFPDPPTVVEHNHPMERGSIHLRREPGLGVVVDPHRVDHFAVAAETFAS